MTTQGSHIEAVRPRQQDAGLPGAADVPDRPRCAAIIAANPAVRVAGLQAAATSLAEAGTASVRVGNPLSSPLTLRRILFQIDLDGGGNEADVDDEAHLARLLVGRQGAQDRIVLVVERAETLDTAALLSLQRLAGAPGAVQVLFVGAPAFWALLGDARLSPLCRALMTGRQTEPAAVAPSAPVVSALAAPVQPADGALPDRPAGITFGSRPAASAWSGWRWWVAGAIGLAATSALGAAAVLAPGGLFYYAAPQRDVPTYPDVAAGPGQPPATARPESLTAPMASAPAASSLPQMAVPARPSALQAPPAASQAARAGTQQTPPHLDPAQPPNDPGRGADPLTNAQGGTRSRQSEQSQSWQPGDAASPAAPSPSEGRVVIHYLSGSGAGAAEADRLAGAAASFAARVQTRMVADTPSAPVIRFFHPEDGARAHQLAGALGGPGPRWDVRDFGDFRPRPSPGTIEVWTPMR